MQLWLMLIKIAILNYVLAAENLSYDKKKYVNQLMATYFKYHGVHSLNFIRCQRNASNLEISSKISNFMDYNMSLQIWWGEDYLAEIPEPKLYGPATTFRISANDSTRQPLKLKLLPLAHKTGIILEDFNTPCALNVLRWSAAAENNYFTTNRFWLLTTKTINDLQALEDEEIFLPPDSEVKVLILDSWEKFSLLDVYKVQAQKSLKRNFIIKNFSRKRDMLLALKRYGSVISIREDLEHITFNTGMVIAFPDMFTNIEDLSMRHIDTISKVNNRLSIELANKLNIQ